MPAPPTKSHRTLESTRAKKAIEAKYKENNHLGDPHPDGIKNVASNVWKQTYMKNGAENGAIYYTEEYGACTVYGAIYRKYVKLQETKGVLGVPATDESPVGTIGRFNHFKKGSIYWTSATGACAINQIGEVSIPFSQSVQEPDLQAKVDSLQAKADSLQAKVDSLTEALKSIKNSYDNHTHTYEKSYLGGATSLAAFKNMLNDKNCQSYLVHFIDHIPSGVAAISTSKPK